MKKNIKDIFDNFSDDSVALKSDTSVSAKRVAELTKMKIREEQNMKASVKTKKFSVPFIAAAVLAALTLTAFAAYLLLTPKDVATHLERYELAEAFSKEDTIFNIPAQTSGDYTIELLGMTSGKNLDTVVEADVDKELTYIVGAVSRADGTPMTDYSNLMVTPLVKGYKPWQINIFTLGSGGKHAFLYEGIEYFLIECASVEIFADNTVYVAAYEGSAPSNAEFTMAEDGTISFNEELDGTKALFELPLDETKADKAAVDALLKKYGFDKKDVIYTQENTGNGENQSIEYEMPEDIEIDLNKDEFNDGETFEYIIE